MNFYTYDESRKLGRLIPLQAEVNFNKEKEITQVVVNQVRASRGESSWTRKEISILRKSALCEITHFYQSLRRSSSDPEMIAMLDYIKLEREHIALQIMKGLTVKEAFQACSDDFATEST